MLPFMIPPVITAAFGALAGAVLARTLVREWRRINAELDQVSTAAAEKVEREGLPKLPATASSGSR